MFTTVFDLADASALAGLVGALGELPQDVDDSALIDRIHALEELRSAVAAAQARATATFVASQRAAQLAKGVPADRADRGIANQVGLARRISPHQATRYTGWATILTRELPHTFTALAQGRTSEWRALIVTKQSVFLSREHRAVVDADLGPRLEQLGDRRVEAEARRIAYRLDPAGFVKRSSAAAQDRRVSIRPAPEVMCRLTALLPVRDGVAAYAALNRAADLRAGDGRSRSQVMADELVERITGRATADGVPVEINITMTSDALFPHGTDAKVNGAPSDGAADDTAASDEPATDGAGETRDTAEPGDADAEGPADRADCSAVDEPAYLDGYGPIPAVIARRLIFGAADTTPMWLRRLFLDPKTGQLVAMDSRRRCFTPAQRHFIQQRDQTCRTPWCDAPIREIDHVVSHADGGPTNLHNAQGYCQACNRAKQAPGWRMRVTSTGPDGHEVQITTPTGHRYRSRAQRPPGPPQEPVPHNGLRNRAGA